MSLSVPSNRNFVLNVKGREVSLVPKILNGGDILAAGSGRMEHFVESKVAHGGEDVTPVLNVVADRGCVTVRLLDHDENVEIEDPFQNEDRPRNGGT